MYKKVYISPKMSEFCSKFDYILYDLNIPGSNNTDSTEIPEVGDGEVGTKDRSNFYKGYKDSSDSFWN